MPRTSVRSSCPSVPLPHDTVDISALSMDELMRMAALTGGKRPTHEAADADDLAWVVGSFADAAARVQAAGLDGVEVHAAHGYLLSTFLSPRFNRRDDGYGGSVEGRARLLVEVVGAIRRRCGDDFAVIVRLDGREYADGGITPGLAARYAALAEQAGAHAIHVSASSPNAMGTGFTDGPLPWQPNQYVDLAAVVKESVNVPVIAVGRISPDAADRLIADGTCDFISMGRQLLADPDLPRSLVEGRPDLVRTCINCFVCVAQNFWDGSPVCAVNARLGHYDETEPAPTDRPRHIVVVGGGPGGMEAARVAAGRGHRVTLLERGSHLGGTARFSALTTPMNAELVRYLGAALVEAGVTVGLDTMVDVPMLRSMGADAVVVATGARRDRPDVPGADLPHVLSGDDLRALLTGDDPTASARLPWLQRLVVGAGRRLRLTRDMARVRSLSRRWMPIGRDVVVIGGGLVGVELAEFLAERGRRVTVLEPGDKLGMEMAHPRRARALAEARGHDVRFVTGAEVVEIRSKDVVYRVGETERLAPADQVVLAAGVHADRSLADAAADAGLEVHVVGDAAEVGYIQGAVRSGYLVGVSL